MNNANNHDAPVLKPGELLLRTELRSSIYKLLSDCYVLPDGNFPGRIQELRELLTELYPSISWNDALTIPDATVEELQVEFSRLFIGPFSLPVPPYGSMYLENSEQLMAESTMDVQRWYQSEGMETTIKEMPDHIRIELEFMYLLVYREYQAESGSSSGSPDMDIAEIDGLAAEYQNRQLGFLTQHIARWFPAFEKKVSTHAKLPMYRELASITNKFLQADIQHLKQHRTY